MTDPNNNTIFIRPKDPFIPTPYIYVTNCIQNDETTIDASFITSRLDIYNKYIKDIIYYKYHFIIICENEDIASTLRTYLIENTTFITQYAMIQEEKVSTIDLIECTSKTSHIIIPGLSIIDNFINEDEEIEILNEINNSTWENEISRRVQHYGYKFEYDTLNVSKINNNDNDKEYPTYFHTIIQKKLNNYRPDLEKPDQITINKYEPGQGIASHTDTTKVFSNYIMSLSLGSDIVMDFTLQENKIMKSKHVLIKKRSLFIMTGPARYIWRHGIAFRKNDKVNNVIIPRKKRISITLRKILNDNNNNELYHYINRTNYNKPSEIEKKHVYDVYENIAPHFNHTRHHPWPKVIQFLNTIPPYSIIADIGCGNGKYLSLNPKNTFIIGSDCSTALLKTCSEKKNTFELFGSDALNIPVKDGSFDYVICIALLHHLSTVEHRLQTLRELARLIHKNGEIFLVAWAFEQDIKSKRKFNKQDMMVEWKLQEKYIHNKENISISNNIDTDNSSKHGKFNKDKKWTVYERYCHLFKESEIEFLIAQIPELKIISTEYSQSNWCIQIKRIS